MESAQNAPLPGLMTPARAVRGAGRASSTVLHFVGRRTELRRVWSELRQGRHLVLAGHQGMGRTALMRQLAKLHDKDARFAFVDFAGTAGGAVRGIYGAVPTRPGGGADRLRYRTARHRLLNDPRLRARPCVLVLDNISRLTPQRLGLIRDLALAQRFRIVAIVGASVPSGDLQTLRRCLNGASVISLGWLRPRDVAEFLSAASEEHDFGWSAEDLQGLAQSLGGYPMGMVFIVTRELQKLGKKLGRP